jgi:hypothetical protein
MDMSKLTPAPWGKDWHAVEGCCSETDSEFIALARNAFDVLMRRGWAVAKHFDHWAVFYNDDDMTWVVPWDQWPKWSDPFTALVEADKWYKENIEKKEPII